MKAPAICILCLPVARAQRAGHGRIGTIRGKKAQSACVAGRLGARPVRPCVRWDRSGSRLLIYNRAAASADMGCPASGPQRAEVEIFTAVDIQVTPHRRAKGGYPAGGPPRMWPYAAGDQIRDDAGFDRWGRTRLHHLALSSQRIYDILSVTSAGLTRWSAAPSEKVLRVRRYRGLALPAITTAAIC
jgi:hypothetical protein